MVYYLHVSILSYQQYATTYTLQELYALVTCQMNFARNEAMICSNLRSKDQDSIYLYTKQRTPLEAHTSSPLMDGYNTRVVNHIFINEMIIPMPPLTRSRVVNLVPPSHCQTIPKLVFYCGIHLFSMFFLFLCYFHIKINAIASASSHNSSPRHFLTPNVASPMEHHAKRFND